MQSVWRSRDVKIDGQNEEWDGAMHIFDVQRLDVGLMNDEQCVYLSLFAGDHERQSQVLASGCTVWLAADDKKAKSFGVRFPHGLAPETRREFMRAWGKSGPEAAVAQAHALDGEPELVGPDGPLMVTAADDSIDVAVKPYRDSLIYELKVPLARIGAAGAVRPGQDIGIGIELGGVGGVHRSKGLEKDPREGSEARGRRTDAPPTEWMDDARPQEKGPEKLSLWIVAKLAERP
jgi:hypothetical protein